MKANIKELLAGLFVLIVWVFFMHKNLSLHFLTGLAFILPFFCYAAGISHLNTRNIVIGFLIGIYLCRIYFWLNPSNI